MNTVFADTFYFLALINARDQAHARAISYTAAFQGRMVTTAWVLTEFADAMSHPSNRAEFIAAWNDLQANPNVQIVSPEQNLFTDGIQLFANRADKKWSLKECISFVVMRRDGIIEALTGDHHFEQAGFTALLK
ncbi:MAG TPA: PIN domain-containing protein [Gemmataceae bacterium]|nr:PIN domain-containing protein [Gemmataceae bacterium]